MDNLLRNNYFVFTKTLGIIALAFSSLMSLIEDPSKAGIVFLISAVFLLFSVVRELDADTKRKVIWNIGEGIAAVVTLFLFPVAGICFAAITYLDFVCEMEILFYFGVLVLLPVAWKTDVDIGFALMVALLLVLIYYQHYKIVSWYVKTAEDNLEEESRLKSDIEHSKVVHRDELKQSRLRHENELLEEKGRISQALHDKLGHSINGSLYKLEAVKVLMDKDPDKSGQILQEVIDNLRGSMDEIRVIIRNERPDKKRMALKSLQALLNECEEEYNIKTSLHINEADKVIPENIWEIILDNAFEAVTNALKYSECDEISIDINILEEVVRATIKDNGKGAYNFEDGMGIQGMKERVRKVKGYIDIESVGGFKINMILPITKPVQEEDNGSDKSSDS